jgi:hypothetical protein
MTSTLRVPATIDEAQEQLDQLGQLATATEWRRAAIVAAFVRLDEGHGQTRSAARFESARAFAERNIVGLRSANTVTRYVRCWLDEHNGNYPAIGHDVKVPSKPWPPSPYNTGSRTTPSNIGQAIRDDAKLAEAATRAVVESVPAVALVRAMTDDQRSDALHAIAAASPPPDVERDRQHERRKGRLGDEAANADATIEALGEGARALAHLRLMADAVHRIDWATCSDSSKRELAATIERLRELTGVVGDLLVGVSDDELRALLSVEP